MTGGVSAFPSMRAAGAVLPSEALLPAAELRLPGQSAADYDLPPGTTLGTATAQAWETCQRAYRAWAQTLDRLGPDDAAVGVTRDGWLRPLLDVLGFGRRNVAPRGIEAPAGLGEEEPQRYPVSHHLIWPDGVDSTEEAQVGVAIHLVGAGIDLDVRTQGRTARAPQGMVQELLNRHPRYLWGLLSNGHTIRLLRDSSSLARQSYVEFDLDDIFTHQRFADFRLLFLVLHASRFTPAGPAVAVLDESEEETDGDDETASATPVVDTALTAETCWLERWRTTAIGDGARALTSLRRNVARALEHLGTGFVAHPANDALRAHLRDDPRGVTDFHRALLRVAYRLLVLFVVEDRGLLHSPDISPEARGHYDAYFSTARLRRFAATRAGTRHDDLWDTHLLITDALAGDGLPVLGLPGLAAWLFDRAALEQLAHARIANRHLLAAVAVLSRIPDPVTGAPRNVDYRTLDSEEFGGVYEGLLAYVPRYDPARREFVLEDSAGNDRKKSGSYYTPSALIALVLDEALDPVIDDACRAPEPERTLLGITVVDPAVGSGHFVVAAARRIGLALAQVRTGELEPGPVAVREATADVIGHCVFGVDLNELAVEITKVALWLEAFDGTRPLPFLDGHVKVGNALLGTTPALLADGIPDAAFTVLPGDDKTQTAKLKKRNKAERARAATQQRLAWGVECGTERLAAAAREIEATPARTAADVRRRATAWRRFDQHDRDLLAQRFAADAWCAAFVQRKNDKTTTAAGSGPGLTDESLRRLVADPADIDPGVERTIDDAATAFRFFHWHLEFPTVFTVPDPDDPDGDADPATGWRGGFSCVVGNPPWEAVQLEDKQFFSGVGREDIAKAPNAAARAKMIAAVEAEDPELARSYRAARRASDSFAHLLRGGRFPLTATGKINTYSIFAETFRTIVGADGAAGLITPTGLATDNTTAPFFSDTLDAKRLLAFFDFENESKVFPGVDHRVRFAITAMSGAQRVARTTRFSFLNRRASDVAERLIEFSPANVRTMNPNTGTLPVFRRRADADITLGVYRRHPVLRRDAPLDNPWDLTFKQGLFNMATDSGLFRAVDRLHGDFDGWAYRGSSEYVPLYEAKMLSHFDHRFSTYCGATQAQLNVGSLPRPTSEQHDDPKMEPLARYWVDREAVEKELADVWDRDWMLGWRDIARTSDSRTFVPSVLPTSAVGHKFPLAFTQQPELGPLLHATWSSVIFDYVSRQKISGTGMTFFIVRQLACPAPSAFDSATPWRPGMTLAEWVVPHVLELSYTSWRLRPYAEEMHDDGPPFRWNPERRVLLRADLDAAFMHIYGLSRAETEHVLDSFVVVRKYEMRDHGEFRTRRLVLDAYDRMADATARGGRGWEPLADVPAGQGPRHAEAEGR